MRTLLFCIAMCTANIIHAQYPSEEGRRCMDTVKAILSAQTGVFAVAFIDLQTGERLLWNERETFHAASTMKTPVMMEVYKQVAAKKLSLSQQVMVKNAFRSIVDSSEYALNAADDSQQELYTRTGTTIPLSELVYQMIIRSSNLATNLVMELVGAKNVTQTMRSLGAMDIQVLRGVEDGKAFAKGWNNTTTALDLAIIYAKLAQGAVVDTASSAAMIRTLLAQEHNSVIPALLPKEVKVAHKTGSITGVHHDSGIVFLPDGRKYVLVLLSQKLADDAAATAAMAKASAKWYGYMSGKSK